MTYSVAMDIISELGLDSRVGLYKVSQIFPLAPEVLQFTRNQQKVLVLEETDSVLEALLDNGEKVLGRNSGHVPGEGELTYDIVRAIIGRAAGEQGLDVPTFSADNSIEETLKNVKVMPRPPKLCAGCSHGLHSLPCAQHFLMLSFPVTSVAIPLGYPWALSTPVLIWVGA